MLYTGTLQPNQKGIEGLRNTRGRAIDFNKKKERYGDANKYWNKMKASKRYPNTSLTARRARLVDCTRAKGDIKKYAKVQSKGIAR